MHTPSCPLVRNRDDHNLYLASVSSLDGPQGYKSFKTEYKHSHTRHAVLGTTKESWQ
jgi:hypothetical protein